MKKTKLSLLISLLVPSFIFLSIFIWVGFFATIHFDPHHDGVIFKPAMDVASGKVLFRDTFTLYGALTTFIQAAFLHSFGQTLFVMKLSSVLFYALTAVVLYFVWKRLFSRATVFFAFVIWMFFSYFYHSSFLAWSSVYAFFFQSLALLLFFLFLERKTPFLLLLTGASIALTFWCKQPIGVFVAASFVVSLLAITAKKMEKPSVAWKWFVFAFTGGILASAPFFLYLFRNRALLDWLKQSIVLLTKFTSVADGAFSGGSPIAALFPGIFSYHQFIVWSIVPLTFVYYTLRTLILSRQNKEKTIMSLTLGFAALFSWFQYYPMSDPLHWHWATTPFMAIFVWAIFDGPRYMVSLVSDKLYRFSDKTEKIITAFLVISCVGLVSFVGWSAIQTIFKAIEKKGTSQYTVLSQPVFLSGLRIDKKEQVEVVSLLEFLTTYFRSHPDKQYINVSNDGLYAFFIPSHYEDIHVLWAGWKWVVDAIYPDYYQTVGSYIERHRPVVLTATILPLPNYCFRKFSFVQDMYVATPVESHIQFDCTQTIRN